MSLFHIPQVPWEQCLVPEMEKGQEFCEIKKARQSNELKVNTLSGRAVAGIDKGGKESRDRAEMGRYFPHIGKFFFWRLHLCT